MIFTTQGESKMKKMLLALLALLALLSFSLSALAAVNINTATQADLENLQGIGAVKAKAILDYRKKNGNFKSIDDLDKVDGIGPVTLKNIRKDIVITDAAASKANNSKPADSKAGAAAKVEKNNNLKPSVKLIASGKEAKPAVKLPEPKPKAN